MNPALAKIVKAIGVETAVVIAGAVLAAYLVRNHLPGVRDYVADSWQGAPH